MGSIRMLAELFHALPPAGRMGGMSDNPYRTPNDAPPHPACYRLTASAIFWSLIGLVLLLPSALHVGVAVWFLRLDLKPEGVAECWWMIGISSAGMALALSAFVAAIFSARCVMSNP